MHSTKRTSPSCAGAWRAAVLFRALSIGILGAADLFVGMLSCGLGRKKYNLTRVDSINIVKLRVSLDDTLDVHFRT